MPHAGQEPAADATPEATDGTPDAAGDETSRDAGGRTERSGGAGDLAGRLTIEVEALDAELTEIEMLVAQARTEAERHEAKRTQVAEKLTQADTLPPADITTLNGQLVTLTRRASVMEAQVEVLEGKRKTLRRFRDRLAELGSEYGAQMPGAGAGSVPRLTAGAGGPESEPMAGSPMSRIVLNAQEDLRREIARAMHDGPAQSLTNIVLQAQIVERLMGRDPEGAQGEVRLLKSMVQQTLEATKTFIFDVRPMVLDDLGLVPTLRRAARERGRRANVAVEFDSIGQDRRLAIDLESSLFRILDEALAAYLGAAPDLVTIHLDWSDDVVQARVTATREPTAAMADADRQVAEAVQAAGAADQNLPPALGEMIADRRTRAEGAVTAAREAAIVSLPAAAWREIQQRATTTGIVAVLDAGGGDLRLRADITESATEAAEVPAT